MRLDLTLMTQRIPQVERNHVSRQKCSLIVVFRHITHGLMAMAWWHGPTYPPKFAMKHFIWRWIPRQAGLPHDYLAGRIVPDIFDPCCASGRAMHQDEKHIILTMLQAGSHADDFLVRSSSHICFKSCLKIELGCCRSQKNSVTDISIPFW